MKPNSSFIDQPLRFWANVRTIGEAFGYTDRRSGTGRVKEPSIDQMASLLKKRSLSAAHILDGDTKPTPMGQRLHDYFRYRARLLNEEVEPNLMNAEEARKLFEELFEALKPHCPIPMNKQKGEKKRPAYFTGIINMLIEANTKGHSCNYSPHQLVTITDNGGPLHTLSRWPDGAFPSTSNPVAIWEIKEYYYTTTFGSRVADAVYESLLDGMELRQLEDQYARKVNHYLFVDDHFTWWKCGRSYLCRIVDMLHMGYVDEVLFGREVVDRLPRLAGEWLVAAKARGTSS